MGNSGQTPIGGDGEGPPSRWYQQSFEATQRPRKPGGEGDETPINTERKRTLPASSQEWPGASPLSVLGARRAAGRPRGERGRPHCLARRGCVRHGRQGVGPSVLSVSPQLRDVGPLVDGETEAHGCPLPPLTKPADAPSRPHCLWAEHRSLGRALTWGWARPPPGALLFPAAARAGGSRGTGPRAPPGVGWGSEGPVAASQGFPMRRALPPATPPWVPSEADLRAGDCQHCRHATWHLVSSRVPSELRCL